MIIQGTITQASQPTAPQGQYAVKYQDIAITDPTGKEWYGRIGSKQGYQTNTPISVIVEIKDGQDGTPYNYFRKYNPQYPNQPIPQQSPQPPQQQARPPATPPQAKPTSTNINLSIERQCAAKSACNYCALTGKDADKIVPIAIELAYFIETGKNFTQIPKPDPEITGKKYTGSEPTVPDDDIPWENG